MSHLRGFIMSHDISDVEKFLEMAIHRELCCLLHIRCCLCRRGGIDIKPCPPLKPSYLRQLRYDLNMPMVIIFIHFREGGGMNDIIVRGIVEHLIQPPKGLRKDLRCCFIMEGLHMLITGMMGFGENPCFEWKSGGKR